MVAHLVDVLQIFLGIGFVVAVHDAGGGGDQLFVDGDPPLDPALEVVETHLGIPQVMVDHLPVQPAAKGVHQGLGTFKVIQRHQGLNPLFQQVVD